jgi:hypothetical protein
VPITTSFGPWGRVVVVLVVVVAGEVPVVVVAAVVRGEVPVVVDGEPSPL